MPTIEQRKTAVLDRLDVAGLIAELFDRRTPAGANQVLVLCPYHQENTPSCSVNTKSGLNKCHACGGCGNIFDLYMAARSLDFAAALAELESRCGIDTPGGSPRKQLSAHAAHKKAGPKSRKKQAVASPPGRIVAIHRYFDAKGQPLYQKKRIEPGRNGRRKEFAFEHFTSEGTAPGRGPHPPLLYGLHHLATAAEDASVFIVEGEGKADALNDWGLVAVCSDSGAAGRWPESFNHLFTGRRVIILPDNDAPGEKYAGNVAAALEGAPASVLVLRLPDLPEKGDVIDWISSSRSAGQPDSEIKAEFLRLAETSCNPWQTPDTPLPVVIAPEKSAASDDNTPEQSRSTRGAPRLLAILEGCPLLCNDKGKAFICIDGEDLPIDSKSKSLKSTLGGRYYVATGKTLSREALVSACDVLLYQAQGGFPSVTLPLDDENSDNNNTGERSQGSRGAPLLLAMIDGNCLMCDSGGGTYIQIEDKVLPLNPKSLHLSEALSARYYAATGQTIGREGLTAACQILSHRARQLENFAPLANRCTAVGDALLYDLGNCRAVKITPGAWELVEPAPGTFHDWQHKRPHPEPIKGGKLCRLLDFIRVASEDVELLLFSLVASLAPGLSRPAWNVEGPQGSGKSAAARKIKRLIDPATPEIVMIPRKVEDLDLILSRNFVAVMDNVSFINAELSDYFCGLITGAGLLRRVLHTTSELLEINIDAQLVFTGISALSNRPDLTERLLKIRLERIADNERRTDLELDTEFAEALPEILGGLFDALAAGLELLPNYRPERLPRLAEFSRLAAACAEAASPGGGGRYLAAFFKNQGNQYQALAESDGFFSAVLEALSIKNPLEGSFNEVCNQLREIANPGPKEKFPTARSLRRTLERLAVAFESAGVGFEMSRPGERTANAKGQVSIFTRATSADLSTGTGDASAPMPPEPPPELDGLIFDPGELEL